MVQGIVSSSLGTVATAPTGIRFVLLPEADEDWEGADLELALVASDALDAPDAPEE